MSLEPDWPETDLVFPLEVHTPIYPAISCEFSGASVRKQKLMASPSTACGIPSPCFACL